MEDEKQKKFKNSFHLRIYDLETLKSVNELIQTGTFDSANDLLNRAVQLGIEQIYLEYGKKKALAPPPTINEPDSSKLDTAVHILRENEVLTQDIFIMMNVIESLSATVLNVMRASNNGEEKSGGDIGHAGALFLGLLYVGIHKHGAAAAQVRGIRREQGLFGKFFHAVV